MRRPIMSSKSLRSRLKLSNFSSIDSSSMRRIARSLRTFASKSSLLVFGGILLPLCLAHVVERQQRRIEDLLHETVSVRPHRLDEVRQGVVVDPSADVELLHVQSRALHDAR